LHEISEMAMVPDSECKTPIFTVSAAVMSEIELNEASTPAVVPRKNVRSLWERMDIERSPGVHPCRENHEADGMVDPGGNPLTGRFAGPSWADTGRLTFANGVPSS
jgi:hypothetical protein